MLRAAILRGLRPTTLILNKQPHSKWSRLDRILLHAYQIFEDEISKNTGLPYWVTRSLDPDIILVVEERADEADRLLAEWDKKHGGDEKKRGISRFVVAVDAEGEPFEYGGLTRHSFRETAALEARGDREGRDETHVELDGGYAVIPTD